MTATRLDALKARLAAATTDESRWTDYDIFVRHAREDIACLVAVVEAGVRCQGGFTNYPDGSTGRRYDDNGELADALAYWLEETS